MNDRARAGGFTLVELLVVIAIIVVLAGIIFALSAGVHEKARTTEKMNRYRNLYVANRLYASDNHVYICPASDGSKKWQELLSPYIGDARRGSDVFVDPLYDRPDPRNVNLTGIGMGIYFRTPDSWQRNVVWCEWHKLKRRLGFSCRRCSGCLFRRRFAGERSGVGSFWVGV